MMTPSITDWPTWAILVIGYLIVQRLGELIYARRNTRRLLAEGAVEHGAGHYPLFILLHGGWIIAIAFLASPALSPPFLLLTGFIFSQIFRIWTLASIGRWWTTRIISAPHFPRVKRGPYRFLPHPNYAVVVAEIALVPLLLGAPWVAGFFTVLNAALLWWRIRTENAVLTERVG
ncbi:isoprenylcysteine carboxyl methyltransferase family protein [Sphingorhabdus arenilitoris]|uniref:Isoprenylcysteine carboxyl methyltransferase family protein n=1 Tax=Sphingorhabdus arenilitoris TaxID=1490041 RepID=A0ABV8RDF5_9SPHN